MALLTAISCSARTTRSVRKATRLWRKADIARSGPACEEQMEVRPQGWCDPYERARLPVLEVRGVSVVDMKWFSALTMTREFEW